MTSANTHHKHTQDMAFAATLHCLTGCAIGEILGLVLGMLFGWSVVMTVLVAVGLAFLFGYTLSLLPLLKGGLSFRRAMPLVLAADTLSILTMEVVDNTVMAFMPGAMEATVVNPIFWVGMAVALFVAFWAAYPVNKRLLAQGKGHALLHAHHK